MNILIGTNNDGKVKAAKLAFEKYFQDVNVEKISVSSEVSDQPVNDEIYQGAKNRIKNLKNRANENNIDADFFVSVESGITNKFGEWTIINVAVIEDRNGFSNMGLSQGFVVPEKYVEEIINKDLCHLMDRLFNTEQIGNTAGGVGLLTKGIITRYNLSQDAFIMALIPFINENWK